MRTSGFRSCTGPPETRQGAWSCLAQPFAFGYHSRAMLSRAQEARVRDVLANHPPGTIQTYCLEHLAAAVKIPPGHLAGLAAFVRSLREHSARQTRYGGTVPVVRAGTRHQEFWSPAA